MYWYALEMMGIKPFKEGGSLENSLAPHREMATAKVKHNKTADSRDQEQDVAADEKASLTWPSKVSIIELNTIPSLTAPFSI